MEEPWLWVSFRQARLRGKYESAEWEWVWISQRKLFNECALFSFFRHSQRATSPGYVEIIEFPVNSADILPWVCRRIACLSKVTTIAKLSMLKWQENGKVRYFGYSSMPNWAYFNKLGNMTTLSLLKSIAVSPARYWFLPKVSHSSTGLAKKQPAKRIYAL